jgi:hypothetical protein
MPYCVNCGNKYTGVRNYCEKCGHMVGAQPSMTPLATQSELLATAVERGTTRSHERRRRRREIVSGSNESLEIYLGCVAVVAFLHGLSLVMGPGMANLLNGPLGLVMFAGLLAGAALKVAYDMRLGVSLARSILFTAFAGLLTYGLIYGLFWYLTGTIMHSGGSLFTFNFPTPVPKALPTPTRLR